MCIEFAGWCKTGKSTKAAFDLLDQQSFGHISRCITTTPATLDGVNTSAKAAIASGSEQ